jgi:rod shape-determining protein MreD
MKAEALPRETGFLGGILPTCTLLLLAVIAVVPLRIPGYAAVTPAFVLMGLYYWTVYRPDLMPPLAVFAIGLFADLLTGTPLGVQPLVLLTVRGVVMPQRRYFVGRLFPFVWTGFTLAAAGALGFAWAIGSVYNGVFLDPRAVALQWVLTVAAFPPVSYLLMRLQRLSAIGAVDA